MIMSMIMTVTVAVTMVMSMTIVFLRNVVILIIRITLLASLHAGFLGTDLNLL